MTNGPNRSSQTGVSILRILASTRPNVSSRTLASASRTLASARVRTLVRPPTPDPHPTRAHPTRPPTPDPPRAECSHVRDIPIFPTPRQTRQDDACGPDPPIGWYHLGDRAKVAHAQRPPLRGLSWPRTANFDSTPCGWPSDPVVTGGTTRPVGMVWSGGTTERPPAHPDGAERPPTRPGGADPTQGAPT